MSDRDHYNNSYSVIRKTLRVAEIVKLRSSWELSDLVSAFLFHRVIFFQFEYRKSPLDAEHFRQLKNRQ